MQQNHEEHMEIDGHKAVIAYDPDIGMFRGEFLGLSLPDTIRVGYAVSRRDGTLFVSGRRVAPVNLGLRLDGDVDPAVRERHDHDLDAGGDAQVCLVQPLLYLVIAVDLNREPMRRGATTSSVPVRTEV